MTQEKTITILGEDVRIGFSMAVEIAYEDITDSEEGFSLQQLTRQKNLMALCMATIIVYNPDTKITMERFIREVSAEEYNTITQAVLEAMTAWMKIPKALAKDDKPTCDEEQKKEDEPKN